MRLNTFIIKGFQIILNGSLIIFGFLLTIFMIRHLSRIFVFAIYPTSNVHDILQEILDFFFFFAFISIVVKYFKENYHFPIRYLLYIGITASIRFIIVNQGNPKDNLFLSVVILILLVSFLLVSKFHKQSDGFRRDV
ncbi:phosphate-starvation-inducible protein PsiE [Paenibacillus sp. GCM10012306]|uniref:phosphate-starvation-inducible protein PsiE n=1 Tax=Paenibacillus sp. GCM10012306 TaxID=3317342 RepID=UPI00361E07E2